MSINITKVEFKQNERFKVLNPLTQYDYKQTLEIHGLSISDNVQAFFSFSKSGGNAIPQNATITDGVITVAIPDEMLINEHTSWNYEIYVGIFAYNETSGRTKCGIIIPVNATSRHDADNENITPSDIFNLETYIAGVEERLLEMEDVVTNVKDGEDGATFIPSVDAEGNLSFTNNKNLPNPTPVNIKGDDGTPGVIISTTEPTDENHPVWINPEGETGVDSELSDISTNPIQNKVVKAKLDEIANEIVSQIASKEQLKPEFANSIEELNAITDEEKRKLLYVLPDGYIYAYMETVVTTEPTPNYTDQVPISIDTDGQPYNGGLGYKSGYRISSTLVEKESPINYITGYIPVKEGDVIRLKNFSASGNAYEGIIYYKADMTSAAKRNTYFKVDNSGLATSTDTWVLENGVLTITVSHDGTTLAYIRVTSTPDSDPRVIVTVNEEITMTEGGTIVGYQWANTGHAFVPADYEQRVLELEEKTTRNTTDIAELKEMIESGITEDIDSLELIKNWDSPIYDANIPVFELTIEKQEVDNTTNFTPNTIYEKYDALMEKHPRYITKIDLGLSSDGVNHMYRYDFREPEPLYEANKTWSETKVKAILSSGIHYEWAGIFGLYYALEEIADNPDLFHLRRNTHFIVIPVMNPFAVTRSNYDISFGHHNANGVEIHRNFDVEFLYPNQSGYVEYGTIHHGGTSPLSEVETQYIDNIMKNNTDSALFLTCHNYGTSGLYGTTFIWSSVATKYMCNMGFRLVDKLSHAWLNNKTYGDTLINGIAEYRTEEYPESEYRLGYAGLSKSPGTETKQATKYGIQSTNVEIAQAFQIHGSSENPETALSSFTMSRGAEVYINFLLTALGVYDYKDKNQYTV